GRKKKLTQKIQQRKLTKKQPLRVAARQSRMTYFGGALADGGAEQENVTIQSRDEMRIEDPRAEQEAGPGDDDPSKALAGNLNAFWAKQQRRQLERKYDVNGEDEEEEEGGAAGAAGKYVPPSQRAGLSSAGGKSLASMEAALGPESDQKRFDDRDANTIRCTNISEDTTESNLQDLFSPFGRISRVYLAKDRETMQSRGFAFISFVHHEDAQSAMDALQGHGYDHLILKLEWARPSGKGDAGNAGAEGTTYRSGYGKALAQDTKEKVSFASNLTANR
ncbi:hypothetical protein TeGR_g11724, partial [Tetraparma gracilis]